MRTPVEKLLGRIEAIMRMGDWPIEIVLDPPEFHEQRDDGFRVARGSLQHDFAFGELAWFEVAYSRRSLRIRFDGDGPAFTQTLGVGQDSGDNKAFDHFCLTLGRRLVRSWEEKR